MKANALALAPLLVVLFWLAVAGIASLRQPAPVPVTDSQVYQALAQKVGATNAAAMMKNQ